MSFQVVAVITAKPGSEDVVRDAMSGLVAPTRAESGCLSYCLSGVSHPRHVRRPSRSGRSPPTSSAPGIRPHRHRLRKRWQRALAAAPAIHPLTPPRREATPRKWREPRLRFSSDLAPLLRFQSLHGARAISSIGRAADS